MAHFDKYVPANFDTIESVEAERDQIKQWGWNLYHKIKDTVIISILGVIKWRVRDVKWIFERLFGPEINA